jgi:hypothetical protein
MTFSTKQKDGLKQKKFERQRKYIHFSIQDEVVDVVVVVVF